MDYSDYVPSLMKGVIHLFIHDDQVVLEAAWKCLNSITKVIVEFFQIQYPQKCTSFRVL